MYGSEMKKGHLRPNILLTNDDMKGFNYPAGRVMYVWRALQEIAVPAVWYAAFSDGHVEAAATLGEDVDIYIQDLQKGGLLLNALIADDLCMLMLRRLYELSEHVITKCSRRFQYAFPEEAGVIGSILKHTDAAISMADKGMMHPLKSVAYILREPEPGADCAGICSSCSSKGCPYSTPGKAAYPDAVSYSYGYQQIFRLKGD